MKVNDAIVGALLLALAIAVLVYARTLPSMPGQQYGAGAFPTLIAMGLGGCAIALMVEGLRSWRATPAFELAAWAHDPGNLANLALTLVAVIVYVLFSERVGFIPIAAGILFVLFRALRVSALVALATAVAVALLMQLGFGKILRVPLPWGVLTPIAW